MFRAPFEIGEHVPDVSFRTSLGEELRLHALGGRFIVISFLGSSTFKRSVGVLEAVGGELSGFIRQENILSFVVSVDRTDESRFSSSPLLSTIRFIWDFDRELSALFGATDDAVDNREPNVVFRSFTLVLDPNLRVRANIPLVETETHNQELQKILSNLPVVDLYAGVPIRAPVLVVPRVFDPSLCEELIQLYERMGGADSGVMRDRDGQTVGAIDHSFKRRTDFFFDEQREFEDLRQRIVWRIVKCLLPEIQKAFQFQAALLERYVVACYDSATGGFFGPHRDNTTKGTAHRRFACSFNLNADDFEGGDVRFPEFGSQKYRAPTGGVVVFSCALLHEVLPVTRNRRYAFLPFLYDEAAARIRNENLKYAGSPDAKSGSTA